MDWLIEVEPELSRVVYDNVADLLNLEVDLLFFDTTSTYFELDEPDEPVDRDETRHPHRQRQQRWQACRVSDLRQVQGLPSRPAAGRHRGWR